MLVSNREYQIILANNQQGKAIETQPRYISSVRERLKINMSSY